ncbi:MAG: putative quinol monooxygenase [Bacteroidia bacterium]
MLIRTVEMHFAFENLPLFFKLFEGSRDKIQNFPGCISLELLQASEDPGMLTTLSRWTNNEALQAYRNSELFKQTWAATKVLFDAPPKATSHFLK